jgi:hypothetical protein
MHLELELSPNQRSPWAALVILAVFLLGWLGYRFTPTIEGEAQLLTWTEWQVLQGERRFQRELQRLQQDADRLTELLNRPPDPVRAQLIAERIVNTHSNGEASLQHPRELLVEAALAVRDWAVGAASRETAVRTLRQSVNALDTLTAKSDE